MDSKQSVLINSLVSLGAILFSAFLSFQFSRVENLQDRRHQLNRLALTDVLEKTIVFARYNTVDWKRMGGLGVAYHCNMEAHVREAIDALPPPPNGLSKRIPCEYIEEITNAKAEFRRLSTSARIAGSESVVQAVLNVEGGFDEVLIEIARRGWYARAAFDNYDGIMPDKFEELERAFRKEILR